MIKAGLALFCLCLPAAICAQDMLDLLPEIVETPAQLNEREFVLESARLAIEAEYGEWDYRVSEILRSLAVVQLERGDTDAAIETYNQILHIMKINNGIYSVDQVPVILDLIELYMAEDDIAEADIAASRAELLVQRLFAPANGIVTMDSDETSEDRKNLVVGYINIINLRAEAKRAHECYETKDGYYLRFSNDCEERRKLRADHFIRSTYLQEKNVLILTKEFGPTNELVRDHLVLLASLAEIAMVVTNGLNQVDPLTGAPMAPVLRFSPLKYKIIMREANNQLRETFPDYDPGQ